MMKRILGVNINVYNSFIRLIKVLIIYNVIFLGITYVIENGLTFILENLFKMDYYDRFGIISTIGLILWIIIAIINIYLFGKWLYSSVIHIKNNIKE